jgi:hypothetical protein
MSQKIAVAVIHGIGRRVPDFLRKIKGLIEDHCRLDCGDDVVIEPVYWAPVMQDKEDALWTRVKAGGPLNFPTLRSLMVDFVADALAYQPTDYDHKTYDDIHSEFARTLRRLAQRAGPKAPLCIISHSLGTVIASNFIYDLQNPRAIPERVQAQMTDTALERGETLALLYTLGSPLALWSLRFRDFGLPITVPTPRLMEHYPELPGEWINFYDRDDVVAYPLKTLNDDYASAVTADVEISVGNILTSWNPLSHMAYWTDRDVVRPISEALIRTWKAVNA